MWTRVTTLARGEGRIAANAEMNSWLEQAANFVALPSRSHVPRLIAIGGLSGTGKTTLARALAPHLGDSPGAVILRSDVIRKQLAGVAPTTRLAESRYTPAASEAVYREMMRRAEHLLRAGHDVILDAVFQRETERRAASQFAERLRLRFDGIWLEADRKISAARISARSGDASDATIAVLDAQLARRNPVADWHVFDACGDKSQLCERVRVTIS
jgi:predicted kinase